MERKVLLAYDGLKQVAALPPDSTADVPAIIELAKTLFEDLADKEPADLRVRKFDEDFEEWVDLPQSFVAKSKEKLQVVLRNLKEPAMVRTTIHSMHFFLYSYMYIHVLLDGK